MRDIKYIIKRIIIGVGIALAMMFIKQNVYAYEWETANDTQIPTTDYSVAVSKRTSHRFSMNPSYSLSTDVRVISTRRYCISCLIKIIKTIISRK